MIRVGELVARTVGLVDLCVSDRYRSRGVATTLLVAASSYARSCGADFLVLFADRHDLYLRAGWTVVSNRCSWLRIDDHRSLGTASGTVEGMLVKPLGALAWPAGDVDMLGHVF